MTEKTKRVLSGIQPTGAIHLGNYLGAIKNWVALQDDMECLFCIVDMHAITAWQEPTELKKATLSMAATLLACGIDPKKHILFHQSGNPDHAEMAWICNCVARLGWLNRMTQFKDKAGKHREKASTGLYIYPNLMAADILVYHATHVPVGEDQKQHLELARDIAEKFNHDFKTDFLSLPEPLILPTAARVMSLNDGTKKMSKSDPSEKSRINLTDSNDDIAKKIQSAKTDSGLMPDLPSSSEAALPSSSVSDRAKYSGQNNVWNDDLESTRPEVANLIGIMAAITDSPPSDIVAMWAGKDFLSFKKSLTEAMIEKLSPIREKIIDFEKNQDGLQDILLTGAKRAQAISHPILKKTRELVGFIG